MSTTTAPIPRSILVVDDYEPARLALRRSLERQGYLVAEAEDGHGAADRLRGRRWDAVILDLGLPDMDGLDVLAGIRDAAAVHDVPVMVLSGRADERDCVASLRAGADDYVAKPCSLPELLARLEALLRRRPNRHAESLEHGALRVDRASREVRVNGERVELTRKEFELLWLLASEPKRVVPHHEILRRVWGHGAGTAATLTEHVHRLRRKLAGEGGHDWITTSRGTGYRFRAAA